MVAKMLTPRGESGRIGEVAETAAARPLAADPQNHPASNPPPLKKGPTTVQVSRRRFLQSAAAGEAVAPFVLPSRVWAAETKPNSRLTMGFIGVGTQGGYLLGGFLGRIPRSWPSATWTPPAATTPSTRR